ncbi:MAG: HopJ type III effector protein [Pseudomonadota bacterium]
MALKEFLNKLHASPDLIDFKDVMSVIDTVYTYSPTAFNNGEIQNQAGENEGSCKLFYFAKLNQLSKEQTLACFGDYYRQDVLKNPSDDNHQNIRSFIQNGWEGVKFKGEVLVKK